MRVTLGAFGALMLVAHAGFAEITPPSTVQETLALQFSILKEDPRVLNPQIDRDGNLIRFETEGGYTHVIRPEDLHRVLSASQSQEELEFHLDTFRSSLDSAAAVGAQDEIDATQLIAVIRRLDQGAAGQLSRPLAGELAVFLSVDLGTALGAFSREHMRQSGLDEARAFALAAANQTARGWRPKVHGSSVYMLALDGQFEASLLLDQALWDNIESQIGKAAVAVPARDVLILAPLGNQTALAQLRKLASEFVQTATLPLSGQVMVRDGVGWAVLD